MSSSLEKYTVTLRCVPEDGAAPARTPEQSGGCVLYYSVLAASSGEAVEKSFALHAQNCDQQCGNCQITTETEVVCQDLID